MVFVILPEFGVLSVTSAHHVVATEGLIGGWKVGIESVSHTVSGHEEARRSMTRRHHTESAGLQIERTRNENS
jgi:hypothetical protein